MTPQAFQEALKEHQHLPNAFLQELAMKAEQIPDDERVELLEMLESLQQEEHALLERTLDQLNGYQRNIESEVSKADQRHAWESLRTDVAL
jgi:hypothetical protein